MPAHSWWFEYGHSVPLVRKLGMRLMAQQASAGGAERVNSEMGWIKNKKSNSLGDENFEKITWVHHNLRLRRKFHENFEEVLYVRIWKSVCRSRYVNTAIGSFV